MKLADAFQEEPNVVIAELDADAHRDFAQKFDVHGFPTLKVATESMSRLAHKKVVFVKFYAPVALFVFPHR